MDATKPLGSSPRTDAPARFAWGEHWARFLRLVDDARIRDAENELAQAASRCGHIAKQVIPRRGLRKWIVQPALRLGTFDVVYSWGVLHHTGNLEEAMRLIQLPVCLGGLLVIAVYNDQGWITRYWRVVKRIYQRGPMWAALVTTMHLPYAAARVMIRMLRGRLRLKRGMSLLRDLRDWLGGYPFEVARPADVVEAYHHAGFALAASTLCGRRHGCNEFVFRRTDNPK